MPLFFPTAAAVWVLTQVNLLLHYRQTASPPLFHSKALTVLGDSNSVPTSSDILTPPTTTAALNIPPLNPNHQPLLTPTHISTSESTDSDLSTHIMSATTKMACIEQVLASKPPFLTAGQITPEALHGWEMGCTQYFLHKEVKDDEEVKKVAWGMQDPIIQDCPYLLAPNQLVRHHPSQDVSVNARKLRIHLLYHLELHMNSDLAADYYAENITEKDLHKWTKKEAVDAALCPKGFPNGAMYKVLTAATIAAKKAKKGGNVVAAVDVEDEGKNMVAAVMPVSGTRGWY
ncbi:uncharacterized protein BJ212DRAFT_1304647 [Suillus subaureus]|uniref:Uncharacterized protein n=1 Tax=Suillus subaureus TaxID=48587 RepID=A0A9P7DU34_9AGAM|nr:uncharacterized protein BJ212DRAFT_1304647 [Suillus subaureus]KAG1803252.1 hypothetical protein BJ212DRAFT_1304647 [Suillus subaureus]